MSQHTKEPWTLAEEGEVMSQEPLKPWSAKHCQDRSCWHIADGDGTRIAAIHSKSGADTLADAINRDLASRDERIASIKRTLEKVVGTDGEADAVQLAEIAAKRIAALEKEVASFAYPVGKDAIPLAAQLVRSAPRGYAEESYTPRELEDIGDMMRQAAATLRAQSSKVINFQKGRDDAIYLTKGTS